MSNETMPEKIWAGKVPIIINQTNDEALSVTDNVSTSMQLEYIEYTRTDTIPSRTQVAREFMEEVEELYESGEFVTMSDALEARLRAMEKLDAKTIQDKNN